MTIDYQVLREAAEKATPDEWVAFISTDTGTYAVHTPGDERCEDVIKWTGFDGQKNAENNARYVAAFNPKVALELLGEIKCLEDTNIDATCRISELETNLASLVAENAGLKHAMAVTMRRIAEFETNLAALAVENIALKSARPQQFGQKMMDALAAYEECQDDVPERGMLNAFFILRDSVCIDTPATGAFLAEVRAQGVEMFAQKCNSKSEQSLASDIRDNWKLLGEHATDFAAELRKGGSQ